MVMMMTIMVIMIISIMMIVMMKMMAMMQEGLAMVSLCNRPRITNSFTRFNHSIFYIIFFHLQIFQHILYLFLQVVSSLCFGWPSGSIHALFTYSSIVLKVSTRQCARHTSQKYCTAMCYQRTSYISKRTQLTSCERAALTILGMLPTWFCGIL